jgi:heme/copper-type cytochrome/quinol oxidase subunit 1
MPVIRRFGVLLAGILFLAVGVAGYAVSVPQPSFGWTAYAPLTGTTFTPHPTTFDYFLALAVVGLVLIAGWVGHRIGSRALRRAERPGPR